MEPSNKPSKRFVKIAISVAVAVVAVVAIVVYMLQQPNQQDYKTAAGARLEAMASTRKELTPAVNAYLAAWKNAYNESKSSSKASKTAKPQYDAFKQAEAKAKQAINDLNANRSVNDAEVGTAIRQLNDDYADEIAYFAGLVESYPQFSTLFASGENCSGVLVGQVDSLAERKQKLDAAAKVCFAATDKLKKSGSATYVDYAKKIERRVKQMQADSAVTAQAEKEYKDFETQATGYQQKVADATARNASDKELNELTAELKKVNAAINESRARFEFAGKRYIATVQELPELFQGVYATEVPAKLKVYAQLNDMRTDVLELLLDDRAAN